MTFDERQKFWDPLLNLSGNKTKKYYLKKHYPNIFNIIIEYSKLYNLDILSFEEQVYLFKNNIKELPICKNNGLLKKYRGLQKGYSKNGIYSIDELKHKSEISNLNILEELNKLFEINKNNKSGKLKQILENGKNDYLLEELKNQTHFINILNPDIRHRIYVFKNKINEIPKCICGKIVNFRKTHGEFTSCCGDEKCRSDISKNKFEKTCIEKYNVNHPSKSENYFMKSSYKYLTMPSGNIVKIQGYEDKVIKELLNYYKEEDLIIDDKEIETYIGKIFYFGFDKKQHRYYPDIFIKSENKIIEVKSEWTYNRYGTIQDNENVNLLKMAACLKNNLNFEFIIKK